MATNLDKYSTPSKKQVREENTWYKKMESKKEQCSKEKMIADKGGGPERVKSRKKILYIDRSAHIVWFIPSND